MSRTYRRKGKYIPWNYWFDEESIKVGPYHWIWVPRDKTTKEYKKDLAIYHSDSGTTNFKEPGPSWFRNQFTERPQRREAKRQLQKFMKDPEFEVMLNAKDPLEYWT